MSTARVLITAPFAPEVVPEVKPTSAGVSGSNATRAAGAAVAASSNGTHPGAAPRTTTRTGSWPVAASTDSNCATWSVLRKVVVVITHAGPTASTMAVSSCSR